MKQLRLFLGICFSFCSQVFANNNFHMSADTFFFFEVDNPH